jgi:hypothetical protein
MRVVGYTYDAVPSFYDPPEPKLFYVHKYTSEQKYGGPEEGGWYFDSMIPVEPAIHYGPYTVEETAFATCRALNQAERDRRDRDEDYGYTSVLSYRSTFYTFDVTESREARPQPEVRPHYE